MLVKRRSCRPTPNFLEIYDVVNAMTRDDRFMEMDNMQSFWERKMCRRKILRNSVRNYFVIVMYPYDFLSKILLANVRDLPHHPHDHFKTTVLTS